MASKKTLNAKNLEALGVERLAALLLEVGSGDAAIKRRLRMELAGAEGTDELAKEIRKRLTSIGRSQSFVDWRGARSIARDLEAQRWAIVEQVAKSDPQEALELLWRFMALADSVYQRCDDSNGSVIGVFHHACRDIGRVAVEAGADPIALADRVFDALVANHYSQVDDLIEVSAPALGQRGLDRLKKRMIDLSNQPVQRPAQKDRIKIGWSSSGSIYEDDLVERARRSAVSLALKDIADAQGDVDAYVAQYDEKTRKVPAIAADIAQRLIAAGRADEALGTLDAAEHRKSPGWTWPDFPWENTRIDALEALGRKDDAQRARWGCFERSLSQSHLRAFLERLPDFEDQEAEARALDHAEHFRSRLQALSFLVSWPALDRAAKMVLTHWKDLGGNDYEILSPAADALAAKHPLAATLVLRSMIDFSLINGRSSRYGHAARHLQECRELAKSIVDFGDFEKHVTYEARLQKEHGRKSSFWGGLR